MNAPYFKFGYFGEEVSLIVAFAIGIGFGFFLERAGFGSVDCGVHFPEARAAEATTSLKVDAGGLRLPAMARL